MKVRLERGGLVIHLDARYRCLSSAVLGGGLAHVRTWFNLQVPSDYSRTDPEVHLREASNDLAPPVIGMMTAAAVEEFKESRSGSGLVVATVGLRNALAASGTRPRAAPKVGTINLLIVTEVPLTDAGLVGALQTAVEAKAQALAAARIPALNADGFATGTPTDSICVACPEGSSVPFAGPATRIGGDIARAVYETVYLGALSDRRFDRVSAKAGTDGS